MERLLGFHAKLQYRAGGPGAVFGKCAGYDFEVPQSPVDCGVVRAERRRAAADFERRAGGIDADGGWNAILHADLEPGEFAEQRTIQIRGAKVVFHDAESRIFR